MLKLEDIKRGSQIDGLVPNAIATISVAEMVGEDAVSVIYKLADGSIKERMIYRQDEASLSLAKAGLAWSFDSPSRDFKLALEALRIQMGFAFDPMMAVHTSNIEPLPNQGLFYIKNPFDREPDLDDDSINKDLNLLLQKAVRLEETL